MKKTLLLLLTLISLVGCNNNSFEDYNEWCNEIVEKEKVIFSFIISREYEAYKDTSIGLAFGGHSFIDVVFGVDIEDLNRYIKTYEVSNVTYRIYTSKNPRCKPTLEGYNKWLKDK
jgi:hypothetical protein